MPVFILVLMLSFTQSALAQKLSSKVIYNSDERKEIADESPREIMQFIQKRTLAMVHNSKLFPQAAGDLLFLPRQYGSAFRLCKDERFYEQSSLPTCTASIIGKDLILTAGHCISETSCSYMKFIADYVMEGTQSPIRTYPEKIYACKKIVYENDTAESDIAIIQVDREFNVSPLKIAEDDLNLNDEVVVVGFPSGLPMKSSGLGPLRKITENMIIAELETYGGNSGSPVFKKNSDQIVGILVGGEDDFIMADSKKCFKSKVCDSQSCQGEDIISAKVIRSLPAPVSSLQ